MSRDYRYCPVCGGELAGAVHEGRMRLVCQKCQFVFYQNPAPAAGVILIEDGQLLWVRRKFEPRRGAWTLPAGFLEYDELIEDCAIREMKEETGIDVSLSGIFNAYMAMDDPRTQVVLVLYLGRRIGGQLRPGDDASQAKFFPVDSPPDNIAFRAHEMALAEIIQHVRNRGA